MSSTTCHHDGSPHGEEPVAKKARSGIGRRRFLSVLGGGGLAAAGTLFGGTDTAAAASCGCCALVWCPPNTTMASCRNASHYLWGCSQSVSLHCSCCEKKRANGSYSASAYSCQYN